MLKKSISLFSLCLILVSITSACTPVNPAASQKDFSELQSKVDALSSSLEWTQRKLLTTEDAVNKVQTETDQLKSQLEQAVTETQCACDNSPDYYNNGCYPSYYQDCYPYNQSLYPYYPNNCYSYPMQPGTLLSGLGTCAPYYPPNYTPASYGLPYCYTQYPCPTPYPYYYPPPPPSIVITVNATATAPGTATASANISVMGPVFISVTATATVLPAPSTSNTTATASQEPVLTSVITQTAETVDQAVIYTQEIEPASTNSTIIAAVPAVESVIVPSILASNVTLQENSSTNSTVPLAMIVPPPVILTSSSTNSSDPEVIALISPVQPIPSLSVAIADNTTMKSPSASTPASSNNTDIAIEVPVPVVASIAPIIPSLPASTSENGTQLVGAVPIIPSLSPAPQIVTASINPVPEVQLIPGNISSDNSTIAAISPIVPSLPASLSAIPVAANTTEIATVSSLPLIPQIAPVIIPMPLSGVTSANNTEPITAVAVVSHPQPENLITASATNNPALPQQPLSTEISSSNSTATALVSPLPAAPAIVEMKRIPDMSPPLVTAPVIASVNGTEIVSIPLIPAVIPNQAIINSTPAPVVPPVQLIPASITPIPPAPNNSSSSVNNPVQTPVPVISPAPVTIPTPTTLVLLPVSSNNIQSTPALVASSAAMTQTNPIPSPQLPAVPAQTTIPSPAVVSVPPQPVAVTPAPAVASPITSPFLVTVQPPQTIAPKPVNVSTNVVSATSPVPAASPAPVAQVVTTKPAPANPPAPVITPTAPVIVQTPQSTTPKQVIANTNVASTSSTVPAISSAPGAPAVTVKPAPANPPAPVITIPPTPQAPPIVKPPVVSPPTPVLIAPANNASANITYSAPLRVPGRL